MRKKKTKAKKVTRRAKTNVTNITDKLREENKALREQVNGFEAWYAEVQEAVAALAAEAYGTKSTKRKGRKPRRKAA